MEVSSIFDFSVFLVDITVSSSISSKLSPIWEVFLEATLEASSSSSSSSFLSNSPVDETLEVVELRILGGRR
jgi:hypothetical protein